MWPRKVGDSEAIDAHIEEENEAYESRQSAIREKRKKESIRYIANEMRIAAKLTLNYLHPDNADVLISPIPSDQDKLKDLRRVIGKLVAPPGDPDNELGSSGRAWIVRPNKPEISSITLSVMGKQTRHYTRKDSGLAIDEQGMVIFYESHDIHDDVEPEQTTPIVVHRTRLATDDELCPEGSLDDDCWNGNMIKEPQVLKDWRDAQNKLVNPSIDTEN